MSWHCVPESAGWSSDCTSPSPEQIQSYLSSKTNSAAACSLRAGQASRSGTMSPGVRYCGYKLCEEETADPEKAAEFREKLLDAFDNCSKCKLPYAKVGQYQATPYCMACWLVVSQAPVL